MTSVITLPEETMSMAQDNVSDSFAIQQTGSTSALTTTTAAIPTSTVTSSLTISDSDKVLILQPSSCMLKIGTNSLNSLLTEDILSGDNIVTSSPLEPVSNVETLRQPKKNFILVPHCITFLKDKNSEIKDFAKSGQPSPLELDYCSSDYSSKPLPDADIIRDKEILKIRESLLRQRKVISSDSTEEIYFEEILLSPDGLEPDPNFFIKKSIFSNTPSDNILYGQDALDYCENHSECRLYYPIRGGYFNIQGTSRNQRDVSDILELLWGHYIHQLLTATEILQTSVILILQDHYDPMELKWFYDILLKRFCFKQVTFQTESLAACFSVGLDHCCVIDLGESKTTVAYVHDGVSPKFSQYYLPYGGYDQMKCLLAALKQSDCPITKTMSLNNVRDREFLRMMKNYTTDISTQTVEIFQRIPVAYYMQASSNKTLHMEVGDPLLISSLGYFDTKLFLPMRLKHPNSKNYEDLEDGIRDAGGRFYQWKSGNAGGDAFKKGIVEVIFESLEKSIDFVGGSRKNPGAEVKLDVLFIGGQAQLSGLVKYTEMQY